MINKQTTGFTLIELMVVIAIIGILAAIAYPSYTDKVQKSRRADAQGALVGFASAMERNFTLYNSYCNVAATAGGGMVTDCAAATGVARISDTGTPAIYSAKSPIDGTDTYYDLTINAVTINPAGYTLYASPVNQQANDKCGTLTLTNTGVRGLVNQTAGVTVADCW